MRGCCCILHLAITLAKDIREISSSIGAHDLIFEVVSAAAAMLGTTSKCYREMGNKILLDCVLSTSH